MKEQAARLAEARKNYEELSAIYASRKRQWEEATEELAGFVTDAKGKLSIAENELRSVGLSHYEANPGTKKLPFGLGIRATSRLVYDADVALRWATEHNMALSLDKPAFEKIAKVSAPDFVTVEEVLSVTLPSDSAKLLQE